MHLSGIVSIESSCDTVCLFYFHIVWLFVVHKKRQMELFGFDISILSSRPYFNDIYEIIINLRP